MTAPAKPAVPRSLKTAGRKLWKETVAVYDLRQDELEVLRSACAEADLIVKMEGELDGQPMVVSGSMGQMVTHPLLPELRQHRATQASLLRALKLPDLDVPAGAESAPNQNRAAANSRWAVPYGTTA
ncbi:hypothetical protein [Curtobacterium sp. Arg-1]|uniref:hypothetical protein n=1 Tax=Curtobacterium sp. Arg-1 TaxID=2935040 RepID=UPI0021DA5EA5|nr:hypothetical protein [Curtobacterium sp. Arg-1]UXZ57080.1 hypothetical protein MXD64_13880 [Curtobacterium sp. Arg-1]